MYDSSSMHKSRVSYTGHELNVRLVLPIPIQIQNSSHTSVYKFLFFLFFQPSAYNLVFSKNYYNNSLKSNSIFHSGNSVCDINYKNIQNVLNVKNGFIFLFSNNNSIRLDFVTKFYDKYFNHQTNKDCRQLHSQM